MAAVIAHYLFGRTLYEQADPALFPSREDFEAFMLGNQGPDVLFFNPSSASVGSAMHKADAAELIACMKDAANMLPEGMRSAGRSYVRGLYCHFLLDSILHPFIGAQQKALVNAGVEGLDPADEHEVHAEIEAELDVLALSQIDGATIASFDAALALEASPQTAHIISLMHKYVAKCVLDEDLRPDAYATGLDAYRLVLVALRSPKGVKRGILGLAERAFRRHSIARAMSHRNQLLDESIFDNHEHAPWVHPGTGEVRTEGFWDLYRRAQARARTEVPLMMDEGFNMAAATRSTDFDGNPTRPLIVNVE